METKNKDMCESLIQWFQVLNLQSPHSNAMELSNGVAVAQALNQIAPDTFTGMLFALATLAYTHTKDKKRIEYNKLCRFVAFQN